MIIETVQFVNKGTEIAEDGREVEFANIFRRGVYRIVDHPHLRAYYGSFGCTLKIYNSSTNAAFPADAKMKRNFRFISSPNEKIVFTQELD